MQTCKYCNKTLSIGERFWHESSCALNPKFLNCIKENDNEK